MILQSLFSKIAIKMPQILHICQKIRTFARFIETFRTSKTFRTFLQAAIAAKMYGKLYRISP